MIKFIKKMPKFWLSSLFCVMMIILGIIIGNGVKKHEIAEIERLEQAYQATTRDEFKRAMRIKDNDVIAYGKLKGCKPLTSSYIKGKFIQLKTEWKHYTYHRNIKTKHDENGKTIKVDNSYKSWDTTYTNVSSVKKVKFLGYRIDYSDISKFLSYTKSNTIEVSSEDKRIYSGVRNNVEGTIYVTFDHDEDNEQTIKFYEGKTIHDVIYDIQHQYLFVTFVIIWVILSIFIVIFIPEIIFN